MSFFDVAIRFSRYYRKKIMVIIKFSETVFVCFYSLESIRIKNPPSGAFEVFTLDY